MKCAVILSGCGYLDGAEIRESVFTLLALDKAGCEVSIFAPNRAQHHSINHLDGTPTSDERNILEESARIARGNVIDLTNLDAAKFDALLLPGGFGAAKNLSDFAFSGSNMSVSDDIASVILAFYDAGKPIGALCVAPMLLAKTLEGKNITLTIGDNTDCADVIREFGNIHKECSTDDIVVDEEHSIATCSAYMRDDARISDVAASIEKTVAAICDMVKKQNAEAA